ncbi:Kae1-associated serine/threonine protein kinase [Candidatus Pacearchaeota archaeon]|nr:Kae1-associated serine/threonine protein kinase [Candidatus Pacearchaeota archaeon]
MKPKIIQQGAEAHIILENSIIKKRRMKKSYRLPQLDEKIRKSRTRTEARIIEKLQNIINVPKIIKTDESNREIEMEFIDGKRLSDHLDNLENKDAICEQIGEQIAKLHDSGVIHGDLTTSNMILKKGSKGERSFLYFIDFGLAFMSESIEDKAVDLHLLRQALEAKHFTQWQTLFNSIKEGYKKSKNYNEVIKRFEKVGRRGRYKSQI